MTGRSTYQGGHIVREVTMSGRSECDDSYNESCENILTASMGAVLATTLGAAKTVERTA